MVPAQSLIYRNNSKLERVVANANHAHIKSLKNHSCFQRRLYLSHGIQAELFFKESLIKSNNFELAKTADIFTENRSNRVTITAHFDENSDSFFCAQILLT